ncbi:MAG: hypothetical protein KGI59_01375 [Patescibacteria group bacterium]|nr:hypothetical protein [Patescibacteria group bacterium]
MSAGARQAEAIRGSVPTEMSDQLGGNDAASELAIDQSDSESHAELAAGGIGEDAGDVFGPIRYGNRVHAIHTFIITELVQRSSGF